MPGGKNLIGPPCGFSEGKKNKMKRLLWSAVPGLVLLALLPGVMMTSAQDGPQGRIAFAGYVEDDYEIYVVNADGSGLQQLTDNDTDDYWPRWSPDGTRIAYTTMLSSDVYALRLIDVATGTISAPFGDQLVDDYAPSWSPDGTRIVVCSEQTAYIVDVTGGDVKTLEGDYSQPDWSPDGSLIALERERRTPQEQTVLITPDGEVVQEYTLVDTEIQGSVYHKDWSSDGSQLLVVWLDTTGRSPVVPSFVDRIDVTTDTVERLMSDADFWNPLWSPDGTQIMYGTGRSVPGTTEYQTLLRDMATGETQVFANEVGFTYFPAAWSPDGAYVLLLTFPTEAPVRSQLQVWDMDGNVVSAFAQNINIHFEWNPVIDWASPPG
jgi:Tol biopolymer transport system component